jgi:lipopolysaccharide export system ATP-binding protein
MLDEPFAGIDPVTVQSIQSVICDLQEQGISILITDHAAREILQIVDRCYVIDEGKVLCSGTPEQIKGHEEVRLRYLGDIDAPISGPPAPHIHVAKAGAAARR